MVPTASANLSTGATTAGAATTTAAGRYHRDGFLFPIDVLSADQAAAAVATIRAIEQRHGDGGLPRPLGTYFRLVSHVVMPVAAELARTPAILDAVAALLGDNLLVWSVEFFMKPAHSTAIVSWHQDITYWGLGDTDDEVTAWLALTPATPESGCMRFVPGSHRQSIVPHTDTFAADNMLSRGQEIAVAVDEADAVPVVLQPGQISLHHGRMFHASGPNRTAVPRIGCAIRYIRPTVRQQVAAADYAMLVRGEDRERNFIAVAGADRLFSPAALALHDRICRDQNTAIGAGAARDLRGYGTDLAGA